MAQSRAAGKDQSLQADQTGRFSGYLLRSWVDRARSYWLAHVFGLCLLLVAVEAPLCVFFHARTLERLSAEGALAQATVESVRFWHLRLLGLDMPGGMVDLNLVWTDAAGGTRRQKVTRSSDFDPQIVSDHRVLRSVLPIRYLPQDRDADVLLVDDASRDSKANADLMRLGLIGLGLCALALWVLYAVRRHVRRKYPALPASFTSWPDVGAIRSRMWQTNSFRRVFWQYKQYTIPLLGGFVYGLKYFGLTERIESFTGLSESWVWFALAIVPFWIMDIAGSCHDRYAEWRSRTRGQNTTPTAAA